MIFNYMYFTQALGLISNTYFSVLHLIPGFIYLGYFSGIVLFSH